MCLTVQQLIVLASVSFTAGTLSAIVTYYLARHNAQQRHG